MFIMFDGRLVNSNHIVYIRKNVNFIEITLSTGKIMDWDPGDAESREYQAKYLFDMLFKYG